VEVSEADWRNFLYWNFHSYKETLRRHDFMRVLDLQNERKRVTSACQIEQFKVSEQL
jgi:hypothetical protein